jgi:hypothetical protein
VQYGRRPTNNIINKVRELDPSFEFSQVHQLLNDARLTDFLRESDDIWELLYVALRLDEIGNQVVVTRNRPRWPNTPSPSRSGSIFFTTISHSHRREPGQTCSTFSWSTSSARR